MAADISNLDYFVLYTHDSPDCDIGGSASLEMTMITIVPELAIIGPLSLDRT
jgi:hypothetical protein